MARRWHPQQCWACSRTRDEVGHISATGLCPECGDRHQLDNVHELRDGAGPFYRHWRKRLIESLDAVPVAMDESASGE